MPDTPEHNAATEPAFFDGRILIDILRWNWDLRVAVSEARPRFWSKGALVNRRDFTIHGSVRAPSALRGKTVIVTLSPFGPKVRFGRGGFEWLGHLSTAPSGADTALKAVLMLPEGDIPSTATFLASMWKHLQILTSEDGPEHARISAYFFSAAIPPNLLAWADAD